MKVWNGLARTRFDKVGQEGLAALSAEMIQSIRTLPTAKCSFLQSISGFLVDVNGSMHIVQATPYGISIASIACGKGAMIGASISALLRFPQVFVLWPVSPHFVHGILRTSPPDESSGRVRQSNSQTPDLLFVI